MGKLVNYATSLHKATDRAYIDRMVDDKVTCMKRQKSMSLITGMVIVDMGMWIQIYARKMEASCRNFNKKL